MRKLAMILLLFAFAFSADAMLYPRQGAKPDLDDFATRDLIAWYPIGIGDGNFVANVPSHAGPGILTNVSHTATSGLILDAERGWVFAVDGVNDYIDTEWFGCLDGTANGASEAGGGIFLYGWTVSFWVKPNDGWPAVFQTFWGAFSGGGVSQLAVHVLSDGDIYVSFYLGGVSAVARTANVQFANGQEDWHHVVITINYGIEAPGAVQIYFDGIRQALAGGAEDGDISPFAKPWSLSLEKSMLLGRQNYSTPRQYAGLLDDFKFYKWHFSAWEVAKLYRDSHQVHPVRSDPIWLWPSMEKNDSLLNDWASVANGEVVETTELDNSSVVVSSATLSMAVETVGILEECDGSRVVVQVSSGSSGDEDWSDLTEFYMPVTYAYSVCDKNDPVDRELLDNNEAASATVIEIGDTTNGLYSRDETRWAIITDDTIANSEMIYIISHVVDTSITLLDGLTNAHDNSNDYVTEIGQTRTIYIPTVYKRARIIYDSTFDEDNGGVDTMVRIRTSQMDEVVSSGQVIRLVH
jgi:hypothetical protein